MQSHRGVFFMFTALREIVENNIRNLLQRDIKPLQIVVLPQF